MKFLDDNNIFKQCKESKGKGVVRISAKSIFFHLKIWKIIPSMI